MAPLRTIAQGLPLQPALLSAIVGIAIVQGLTGYFFNIALPAIFRERGATLDVVSLTYIVWLPWALKWLWAPVFDARPALRIGVLRGAPLAMALSFLALVVFDPSHSVGPVIVLALVSATLGATLQIVMGAEIILRCADADRTIANACQVAAVTVGAILGGSVFLWLSENLGWQVSVLITVCLIAGAGLPAFALRPTAAAGGASQLHGRAIQHRGTWFIVVLSALAALADGFLGAWLVDSGFSAVQVGWYLGLVAMLAMLPFAYLASVMLRRLGQGRTLSLLFAAKAALLAVLFIVPVSPMAGVVVAVSIFALSAGLLTSMWQLYMKAVNASYAATGFAFLTSVEAMLLMLGGFLAGQIALRFGYDPLFFIASLSAAVASLLAIPPDISSFG